MAEIKAVIVGEAWGATEDALKHPFVGESGMELARMLAQVGLARPLPDRWVEPKMMVKHWHRVREESGLALTNVFNLRPPGNDVFHFFDRSGDTNFPPFRVGSKRGFLKPEFIDETYRLYDEIAALRPNVIIAMGNAACWALFGETKITALRGTIHKGVAVTQKVLPTYHPALILRQWSFRVVALADLDKARREAEFSEIRRPERFITIPSPDASGVAELRSWLEAPASRYAVDIETAFGQISIVGFARSPSESIAIPFHNPGGSDFWPEAALEVEAWRAVRSALQRPIPKTFQNGLYDISYFLRNGILPRDCLNDTMLRHHSMFPELPKSLGFLGSLYCNDVAWKSMIKTESMKRDD